MMATSQKQGAEDPRPEISSDERDRLIAETAYFRALERGFEHGDPLIDWLDAEKEIDAKFELSPHDTVLELLYERLAKTNEKLRQLVARARSEAHEECSEELERIHKLRDVFGERLNDIRELTGDAREHAKHKAQRLWKELSAGLSRLGAHFD